MKSSRNIRKNNTISMERGRRNRSLYIKNRTGYRCECCGEEFPEEVLEFHHRDPETKKFGLDAKVWRRKLAYLYNKDVIAEADKCVILCSNCHRLEHVAIKNGETLIDDKDAYHRYRNHRYSCEEYMYGGDYGLGDGDQGELFESLPRETKDTGDDKWI